MDAQQLNQELNSDCAQLRLIARRLDIFSKAFRITGNDQMGSELAEMADDIRRIGTKIVGDYANYAHGEFVRSADEVTRALKTMSEG